MPYVQRPMRIAFRVRDDFYVAVLEDPEDERPPLVLGSIAVGIISHSEERRDEFIALMRNSVADMFDAMDIKVAKWGEPIPIPDES